MNIADRMSDIPFSGIRKILEKVNQMEKDGRDVVRLEIGRPDFDTPQHIKDHAIAALNSGEVHYSSNAGINALKEAIAEKLERDNQLHYSSSDIIVTAGANEAVFIAMMATLNPGDEVLIPDPSWVAYYPCATMAGAKPVPYPTTFKNGFIPRIEDIEKRVTDKTKMIVINSPHNPTGVVYDRQILSEIAALVRRHDLFVLSDEIYERIIYDHCHHLSIATLPDMHERTIVVNGMSKIYSMTGWRIGYTAAPKLMTDAMLKVHQNTIACANTFAQFGAAAALTSSQACADEMVAEFNERRDYLIEALGTIKGINIVRPQGAFYLFADISSFGMTSEQFATYLLEEAEVAVVPGSAFGQCGEGCIRMSYANSLHNLKRAVSRIAKALESLSISA